MWPLDGEGVVPGRHGVPNPPGACRQQGTDLKLGRIKC